MRRKTDVPEVLIFEKPRVYWVAQSSHFSYLFSLSASLSLSLMNFACTCSCSYLGPFEVVGHIARAGDKLQKQFSAFLSVPWMFFKQREEAVGHEHKRKKEMELIWLISRQKTVRGEMNGERKRVMQMSRCRGRTGFTGVNLSEKWVTGNMWDCKTVRGWCQNCIWRCSLKAQSH